LAGKIETNRKSGDKLRSRVQATPPKLTDWGVGEGTQTISTIASPLAFRNDIRTRPVGT
jgi:hypothetical protein